MSRPRAMTAQYCLQCRVIPQTDTQVEYVAQHRMQHRRQDKRRAQWRAHKNRKRMAPDRIGALHALSCRMPTRCTCRPIPVYTRPLDEAA